jgi:ribosomal subunit interface protein
MKLKWTLVSRNMRPHSQIREKLGQKIEKLEAHLEHFPEDAVHLQVSITRNPKRLWFTAALNLHLPSNTLHAEKSGEDPIPAFDQAVKALLREVASLKSSLRREKDYRDVPRQTALTAAKSLRSSRLATASARPAIVPP